MKPGTESRIKYVFSGNYITSKKKKEVLEAHLATCVGVTLCDREAELGGLIHLLLPEPTGLSKPLNSVAYATTGMPLFIQTLCEAGASKNRMEACIAGGALVGPLNRLDLDLDIGGRTAEIVHTILSEEGIPVGKFETGGYSCCRLRLDLVTFESSILPMVDQSSPVKEYFRKPGPNEIVDTIHRIRPIPQIALKIARMTHEGDYDIGKVAREIKQDQVISGRVITLSNSSFIGLRKKVDSIERALVVLGENHLLQLVLSASMELYFSDCGQGYSLCKGGLFQHALGTAIVSEELAKHTAKASPEIAYTAGLLHDIGKVVLDQYVSSQIPFFYRRTQIDGIELCEAESEKLGITHPEAGELLAENWSLPENLTDTIRYHHCPEQSTIDPELTHLVYLADLLMSRFQAGRELECLNMDKLSSRLQKVGLATSQFPILVDLIPQGIFESPFIQAK
ncbi:MAG: HDOD domain-containing protein [Deltaproteobacteria bacterium]|nr:HDOD domain-containing protein [Deltaproteobacteria bacterium]